MFASRTPRGVAAEPQQRWQRLGKPSDGGPGAQASTRSPPGQDQTGNHTPPRLDLAAGSAKRSRYHVRSHPRECIDGLGLGSC